jgi:hypothetical protein
MPGLLLEAPRIVETIERLKQRIDSRFVNSSLSRICGELLLTAQSAAARSAQFERPIIVIRLLTWLLIILLVGAIGLAVTSVGFRWRQLELTEFIQASEAGLNEAVLLGAGLYFLIGLERRIKRSRALRAIHELRSVAHIIDMHQLTKDPERLLNRYKITDVSPKQTMSAFELSRYLDYCSELLSLTGKVAAIYVQRFDDPVVLDAVGEIEDLTTGLCQKIWQKLTVLQEFQAAGELRKDHEATASRAKPADSAVQDAAAKDKPSTAPGDRSTPA